MTKKTYKNKITHARLKELVQYDKETGQFFPIGTVRERESDGYLYVVLDGERYSAAQIAWFYHRGEWPKGRVTSVDGDNTFLSVYNLSDDTGPLKTYKGTEKRYMMTDEEFEADYKRRQEARFLADMAEID